MTREEVLEQVRTRVRAKQLDTYEALMDKPDMVNKPPHYQGAVEVIDAIESALGAGGFEAYCRGNALKYISRAGKKGSFEEDIRKAIWYLERVLK